MHAELRSEHVWAWSVSNLKGIPPLRDALLLARA